MSDLISRAYEIELARSADANQNNGRLINADAQMDLLKARKQFFVDAYGGLFHCMSEKDKARCDEIDACIASIVNAPTVSADAAHGRWNTGKPTKGGKYIVTLIGIGDYRFVDIMHYDKPCMPNREVSGECWYRDDDEWGDVVYDDKDIIAWIPLPTPYKGGDDE